LFCLHKGLEHCLVVGTEEMNWVLPAAFRAWRMTSRNGSAEVFGKRQGIVFGEAAGALLLSRGNGPELTFTSPGQTFYSAKEAAPMAASIVHEAISTAGLPDAVVASANSTFADSAEADALLQNGITAPVYAYKPALGDALGASAVLQVVFAFLALRDKKLPGTLGAGKKLPQVNRSTTPLEGDRCLITAVGFNQQVNALTIHSGQV
jgi:3-oxoacyl-(acyl-carrier-protein) synthase